MSKQELIYEVFNKAYKNAHRGFNTSGYYRLSKPAPLKMDDGSVVNVEWVQPSYWSTDVLINYRTNNLKAAKMSEKELEQLLEII